MPAPENRLKTQLLAGGSAYGLWLNLVSPVASEIAAQAGFDWCLIDAEHSPNDLSAILGQVHAMQGQGGASIAVRVPKGEDWILKQVLDLGIQTVVVPMIDTAEDARKMARAMRYPPDGNRGLAAAIARASGYNTQTDYAVTANEQVLLFVQAETSEAIDNIESIAAVDGVDGIFIGPGDLAASMGYITDFGAPEVAKLIDNAIPRIRKAGKIAGILNFDPDQIAHYRKLGAQMLAVGSDLHIFSDALHDLAQHYKS